MAIRRRWLVAALAAASFSIAACKKKEAAQPAPGTASGATVTEPKQAPALAAAAAPKDDLALLPVDSEAVIGVQWAQLTTSPLWKKFVEPQLAKDNDFVEGMATFKQRCGFDPMQSIQKISVGMKGLDADTPDGVIVVHGLDKAKTLACVEKWQEEAAKENITVKKDGDVVVATGEDGTVAFTFLANASLLVVVGPNATGDGVRKASAGGSTLSTSPAFVEMYSKLDTKQTVWMLVNGSAKPFEELAAFGLKPKAVFGSINVTGGLSADLRARLDSADQASQTAEGFRGQAQAMSSFVDKLEITNDGPDVKVVAAASEQKLDALMQMFAQ